MEKNQYTRKRIAAGSKIPTHEECIAEYLNYIEIDESEPQVIQHIQPNAQQQVPQTLQHTCEERPLRLNMWTQTDEYINTSEEFEQENEISRLTLKMEEYKKIAEQMQRQKARSKTKKSSTSAPSRTSCTEVTVSPINVNQEDRSNRLSTQSNSSNESQISVALNKREQVYTIKMSTPTIQQKEKVPSPPRAPSTSPAPLPESPKTEIKKKDYLISIGPNDTQIRAEDFATVDWKSTSSATRKLLTLIFDRKTLATHSMTGKPSPAFRNKPVKKRLDQKAIKDIVYIVSKKCSVSEKEVRSAITTKCADENKIFKTKTKKEAKTNKNPLKEINENTKKN